MKSPCPTRILAALALVGAMALAPSSPAQSGTGEPGEALQSFYSGNGFLNRELYELAASEYRAFLAAHPEHEKAPEARYGLAISLFKLERYDEAAGLLTALRKQPSFPYGAAVEVVFGQCRLMQGRFQEAAESFRAVLKDHAEDPLADDAAALAVEALYRAGAYAEADAPCALLIERWPESPQRERAEFFRGLAQMARGQPAKAAAAFEGQLARFPEGKHAAQTALLLAQSLHQGGAADRAAGQYRQVIDAGDPRYVPEASYGLALLDQQQGRPADAGTLLDGLLEAHPDHPLAVRAIFLRGRVWFDLEQYEKAFARFEEASAAPGDLADDAAYWMAKCDLRRERPNDAARRLGEALEQHPRSELRPEMTYDRAVAQMRSDKADGAATTLGEFLTRFPDHALTASALHLLASAEHRLGHYARSAERCREFAERFPTDPLAPEIAFLAAENDFLQQSYEPAAAGFARFLKTYPDHPQGQEAAYRLGMSLYHLQRYDEAAPRLAAVVENDADKAFPLARYALGDVHFQRGEWEPAVDLLRRYVAGETDPEALDDAQLKLGLAELRRGRAEIALGVFDDLLERPGEGPERVQARFERGQALVTLGRGSEARAVFEQVLDQSPDSRFTPYALNHLGTIAHQEGRYDEAAAYFKRVEASDPPPEVAADAVLHGGEALLAAARPQPAYEHFERFITGFPEHPRRTEAEALAAIALARTGRHDEALPVIEQVEKARGADLDPPLHALLLYERAWCLRKLDRTEDAQGAYRGLLELPDPGPLRLHAMLELAELEADAERFEDAADRLRQLRGQLESAPDAPAPLREQSGYRLGVCAYRLDHFQEAAEVLESFLQTWPESDLAPSAELLCGESLMKLGQHQRAMPHLSAVVEHHADAPEYGPCLLRLGTCLATLQQWPGSEQALTTYLERFPDAAQWYEAQFGVGWSREQQGRQEEAIPAYRAVVQRHHGPTAARAQFQIGECHFALKRYEEAVRNLLKVDILFAYPRWSAAALYEAGRCFRKLSDPVQARRQFEQVQAKYADTEWAALAAKQIEALEKTTIPGH